MKQKVIVWLLLLATVFCSFPFAVSAEETVEPISQAESEQSSETALADYYVKDGLVALFTAFDDSYISASGVWTDRVNGNTATLTSYASRWSVGANGGVGFNTYYGMIDEYGVFQTSSPYNNASVSAVRVDFGLSLLPQEDMTIEYLAMYKPVYVTDSTGVIAKDDYGDPIETFDQMGNGPSGFANWPIDALGWFSSYSTHLDGYQSGWGAGATSRGALYFMFDNTHWSSGHNGWWVGTGNAWTASGGMNVAGDAFHQNGTIRTYEYSIDETLTVAGDGTRTVTALFAMRRDLVLYKDNSGKLNSTANASGGSTYYDKEVTGKMFHLSADRPTDFYSIRIYNRTLNDEERLQNRVADIIHYYGIEIRDESILPALRDVVASGNFGFATDVVEKAAVKAEILHALSEQAIINTLYAQEGLQALYTAFDDTYIDLGEGTWTDRLNGKTATLGNKQYWSTDATNGGVSSLMLWGSYIDGAFTADAATNNASVLGTRLDFGIDQLPAADWTVEYLAQYNYIMAVDASGKPTTALNSITGATWPDNTSSLKGGIAYGSVEQFGNLFGMTLKRDSYFTGNGEGGYYGGIGGLGYQYTVARRTNNWNIEAATPNNMAVMRKTGLTNVFHERGAIHTFEQSRDSENDTTNTLTQTKDLSLWVSSTTTNVSCAEEHTGDNDYFYLGERLSVDYYAVRIYNRLLTDAERNANRLADLIFYYDLSASDTVVLQRLAKSLDTKSYAFETDATKKAERKAELQMIIDKEGTEVGLYAQDGLQALYTAFGTNNYVDTAAGTWTDRITGRTATLVTGTRWTKGTSMGGVGFSVLHGMMVDGAYTATSSYNNVKEGGPRLDLGISLLPEEDFTVEYLAMYKPVYVADENGNIALDASGKPIETFVAAGSTGAAASGSNSHLWPVDALGWFSAFTSNRDGYESGWGASGRGALQWMFNNMYWGSGNLGSWVGGGAWTASGGMNIAGNAFHQNGSIRTYEYSVDETLTVAEDGTRTITALFSMYRDLTFYKDNSNALNTTANTSGGAAYFDKSISDSSYKFHLSCSRPTDFYAVRVYNRILTDEDRRQNRFADILNYYGVTLPDGFTSDDAQMEYTMEQLAGVSFETDATLYAQNKAAVQAAIKNVYTNITIVLGTDEVEKTILGDSYYLPAAMDGRTVFAWHLMGENDTYTSYAPNQAITVSEGDVLRAVALAQPATKNGTTVKMMGESGVAMRFTATLSKSEFLTLREEYGAAYVRVGMLITPKAYVESAGEFTREALESYASANGSEATRAYIQVASNGFYSIEGDLCTVAASIYNFTDVTIEKNPAFAAIAYVDIDTDKDGVADKTVYGEYSAASCRTVKKVMELANEFYRDSMTDSEQKWVDSYLSYYQNRTYGEAGDKTVTEQREEILAAMQAAMGTVVEYTVHEFSDGEVADKYAHIQAISFDGLTMNGMKTRVFAYVGLPEGASAEDPVPAVVLIHGGGGHAFLDWVYRWNQRGYAAIAMETTGCFPVTPGANVTEGSYSNAPHEFPDYILEALGDDAASYTLAPSCGCTTEYAEVDTMWQYHAISQVILSHNVLRQNEAIDSTRIGVEGVSWGGVLTSHVIGYDNRFAFAIPAYGTGYLGEEEKSFSYYNDSYVDDLWAPERNFANATMPVLWFDWADDTWFIVNGYSKSYLHTLKNNAKTTLVLLKDWSHSHVAVFTKEHGYAFADSICFGTTPLVNFSSQPEGREVSCQLNVAEGVSGVTVKIHYLTEPIAYENKSLVEDWKTDTEALTYDAQTKTISGTIPSHVRSYFISVTYMLDGKALESSSSFVMLR